MPFVVMCGLPSSGKTSRAHELKAYLNDQKGVNVNIISDHGLDVNKNDVYAGIIQASTRES